MGKFQPAYGLNGITDWRPNSMINAEIEQRYGITDPQSYRLYLMHYGDSIRQAEFAKSVKAQSRGCTAAPNSRPNMLPSSMNNFLSSIKKLLGL